MLQIAPVMPSCLQSSSTRRVFQVPAPGCSVLLQGFDAVGRDELVDGGLDAFGHVIGLIEVML